MLFRSRDQRAFTLLIRNEVFRIVRALAFDQFQEVIDLLEIDSEKPDALNAEDLKAMADSFYEDHESIRIDPDARNPKNTLIEKEPGNTTWKVQQRILDPEQHNDWCLDLILDLEKSQQEGIPILQFLGFKPVEDLD